MIIDNETRSCLKLNQYINYVLSYFKFRLGNMYLMKIKGSGKIPDYLQIRDNNYTLIAYFRADRLKQGLTKYKMTKYLEAINNCIGEMNFGEMKYLEN